MTTVFPTIAELLAGKQRKENVENKTLTPGQQEEAAAPSRNRKRQRQKRQLLRAQQFRAQIQKKVVNVDIKKESATPQNKVIIPPEQPPEKNDNPETNSTDGAESTDCDSETEKINVDESTTSQQTAVPDYRIVVVENLCASTSSERLLSHMKKYGDIENIDMKEKSMNTTISARIHYKNVEDAKKAYAENGKVWNGRHLQVSDGSPKKMDELTNIIVGNLDLAVVEEDLWRIFECCGEINQVTLNERNTTCTEGGAKICFESPTSVNKALEMEEVLLYNKPVKIMRFVRRDHRERSHKKKNKLSAETSSNSSQELTSGQKNDTDLSQAKTPLQKFKPPADPRKMVHILVNGKWIRIQYNRALKKGLIC